MGRTKEQRLKGRVAQEKEWGEESIYIYLLVLVSTG
jgi:hypothetical protein